VIETPNGTPWVWGDCKLCGGRRWWYASREVRLSFGDASKRTVPMSSAMEAQERDA
jgi:hypothetical protein